MLNIEIIEETNDGTLYLRQVSKDDVHFFYDSLQNQKMNKYLSLGPLMSLTHAKKLIKSHLESWERWSQFNYMIELREEKKPIVVGSISLWNISWLHRRASIGIWIIPEYWNQGIGKKSISLIKNIAFIHLNLNRLEAYVAVENEKSIGLFQASGFRDEGTLTEYLNLDGFYYDAKIFAFVKKNFI